jgi:hypothetical protein
VLFRFLIRDLDRGGGGGHDAGESIVEEVETLSGEEGFGVVGGEELGDEGEDIVHHGGYHRVIYGTVRVAGVS